MLASASQAPALAKSRARGLFGTADQPALGGGQALPGTPVVRVQLQRLTETGQRAIAVFADTAGAQVVLAGAVVGHHALGQFHPPLQRAHLVVAGGQRQQHQSHLPGLQQRLPLLQRPHQQRVGLLLKALARPLQPGAGLAVVGLLFLHRQPQRDGRGLGGIQVILVEGLLRGTPQLGQAAPLAFHARRRPALHVFGRVFTANGHLARTVGHGRGLCRAIGIGLGHHCRCRLWRRRAARRSGSQQQGGTEHG